MLPERANEKQTKTAIEFFFAHRLLHSLAICLDSGSSEFGAPDPFDF